MPPTEHRALLSLLLLAVAGQGVRYLVTRSGEPPGQVQLLGNLSAGSPVAHRDSAMRQARPLRPGERIDLDRAPLSELNRLPRIGPRLAKTILAHRSQEGPFGSLAGLDRVPGIGPGLLRVLEPHAAFSGTAEPALSPADAQPVGGAAAARLDLNSATMLQLDSLPGVGRAKAAAILRYRQEHGPFAAIEQLEQVEGFGPAAVARLRDRLEVR